MSTGAERWEADMTPFTAISQISASIFCTPDYLEKSKIVCSDL